MNEDTKTTTVRLPNGTVINDVVSITPQIDTHQFRIDPEDRRRRVYTESLTIVRGYAMADAHGNEFYIVGEFETGNPPSALIDEAVAIT